MLKEIGLFAFGLLFQTIHLQGNACVDSIYMKIPYTTKFIDSYISEISNVSSAHDCLELCRNHGTCKSVGIKTSSITCYLYDGRMYAGLSGTVISDIIYYWLLESECPVHLGYSEDPSSKICTKPNSTQVTWFEAQDQCENDGGFLFMLDSTDSMNIMETYSAVLPTLTFVGATDVYEEGVWTWFNGVPVNDFILGDPNNGGNNEHCLVYAVLTPLKGLADYVCQQKTGFVCQIPTKQTYLP